MIVMMRGDATEDHIRYATEHLRSRGIAVHCSTDGARVVLSGESRPGTVDALELSTLDGVARCLDVESPYQLASRAFRPDGTVVCVGAASLGGQSPVVIAGCGCAESAADVDDFASRVAASGATMLRARAFEKCASPYCSRPFGAEALYRWRLAADRYRLPLMCDVSDPRHAPAIADHADMLRVDARHMQDFNLLKLLGRQPKPVLLTRGESATLEELLLAAEYIMANGNHRVVLCEAGIRTFEASTRHAMDLAAIPALKLLTHLPVVADPSAGTAHDALVAPMSCAALAAGADGVMLDVYMNADAAGSDGAGSLHVDRLAGVVAHLTAVAAVSARFPSSLAGLSAGPNCPAESTVAARRTPRALAPTLGAGL
jgi:3-deoxy-7-phosphoheptulonate synthase